MNKAPENRYRVWDETSDGVEEPDFKPLDAQAAAAWRRRQPQESVWGVVKWQLCLGLLALPCAWWWSHQVAVVQSVVYGVMCALLPTALMAYGLTSSGLARWMQRWFPKAAGASLAGLFFWEGVKVLLVLAMLWSAPKLVPGLSWLALVAGLVVALKAYWLEFWMRSRRVHRVSKIL